MPVNWDSEWIAVALSYYLMTGRNSQVGVSVLGISLLAEPNGNLLEGVVGAFIS